MRLNLKWSFVNVDVARQRTLLVQICKQNISIALHVTTENALFNYHFPISERHPVASPLNTGKRYVIVYVFVKLCSS